MMAHPDAMERVAATPNKVHPPTLEAILHLVCLCSCRLWKRMAGSEIKLQSHRSQKRSEVPEAVFHLYHYFCTPVAIHLDLALTRFQSPYILDFIAFSYLTHCALTFGLPYSWQNHTFCLPTFNTIVLLDYHCLVQNVFFVYLIRITFYLPTHVSSCLFYVLSNLNFISPYCQNVFSVLKLCTVLCTV